MKTQYDVFQDSNAIWSCPINKQMERYGNGFAMSTTNEYSYYIIHKPFFGHIRCRLVVLVHKLQSN